MKASDESGTPEYIAKPDGKVFRYDPDSKLNPDKPWDRKENGAHGGGCLFDKYGNVINDVPPAPYK